jgi:hypothetical protein
MKISDVSRRIAIAGLATFTVTAICGINGMDLRTTSFRAFFGRTLIVTVCGMFIMFFAFVLYYVCAAFVTYFKAVPNRVRQVDVESESEGKHTF